MGVAVKYIFCLLMLVHGLIHCMGFAKAFTDADLKQLTIPISKPVGILWLLAAILFVIASVLEVFNQYYWSTIALLAVLVSQTVLLLSWQDAKWGTIANALILLVAIFHWGNTRFEKSWRREVQEQQQHQQAAAPVILTEQDIRHLPQPVQAYLQYAGVLGKPKAHSMRVVMQVEMREKGKDFFPAVAEQYNFFGEPTRLFFMKARMFGLPVYGYHHYIKGKAVMDIRFAGLIAIVRKEGPVMDKAETVTVFNDMCLMAPATLIDQNIQWETIDSSTVKAVFTNPPISVTAVLSFNEKGQLADFVSNDRTEANSMQQLPFSTPVHRYQHIHGFNLFEQGDAVWTYPDGPFVYGRFILKEIQYN